MHAIVHEVEKGPSGQLTRFGRPVAVLLSIKECEALRRERIGFWDALAAFRNQIAVSDLSDADFENLRDFLYGREVEQL